MNIDEAARLLCFLNVFYYLHERHAEFLIYPLKFIKNLKFVLFNTFLKAHAAPLQNQI